MNRTTEDKVLRFAANLSMMYNEYPFLQRFGAAARDGFKAVEYLFPYEYPAAQLASELRSNGLSQVLLNAPAGNWAEGERGLACLPGREVEFQDSFRRALAYAQVLECPRVHVMAGVTPQGADRQKHLAIYAGNLAWAAAEAEKTGREVLIEPINTRDMPGYLLNRQDEAQAIIAGIGRKNLKVQFDLYHCANVEGDVAGELRKALAGTREAKVGHMQIAGVPGRHEPDTGDLNFDPLLDLIEEQGFDGWIGLEYRPLAGTSEGLKWLRKRS